MKSHLPIMVIALLLLFNQSFAQPRNFYCQGCCGCINSFYLSLDSGRVFEISYAPTRKVKEDYDGNYGKGTYVIENKILTLNFEELPTTKISVQQIADSDSLIVHFEILDSGDTTQLIGTNIKIDKSADEPYPFGPYNGQVSTLRIPFASKRTISLSFIGRESVSYEFKEPGVFNLKAELGVVAKYKFKRGQQMKFRMRGHSVKSIDGDRIKLVSRNCRC